MTCSMPRVKHSFDGRARRSIRLLGYDYTTPGAYFVTICTYSRQSLFGDVAHGKMMMNEYGRDLAKIWARTVNGGTLPEPYEFVVMPNHIHGIVCLPRRHVPERWPIGVGAQRPPLRDEVALQAHQPESERRTDSGRCAPTEGRIVRHLVRSFKSSSTKAVNRLRGAPGLAVWQRRYYERIIRDERELTAIRQYILDNPAKWADDPNNVEVG